MVLSKLLLKLQFKRKKKRKKEFSNVDLQSKINSVSVDLKRIAYFKDNLSANKKDGLFDDVNCSIPLMEVAVSAVSKKVLSPTLGSPINGDEVSLISTILNCFHSCMKEIQWKKKNHARSSSDECIPSQKRVAVSVVETWKGMMVPTAHHKDNRPLVAVTFINYFGNSKLLGCCELIRLIQLNLLIAWLKLKYHGNKWEIFKHCQPGVERGWHIQVQGVVSDLEEREELLSAHNPVQDLSSANFLGILHTSWEDHRQLDGCQIGNVNDGDEAVNSLVNKSLLAVTHVVGTVSTNKTISFAESWSVVKAMVWNDVSKEKEIQASQRIDGSGEYSPRNAVQDWSKIYISVTLKILDAVTMVEKELVEFSPLVAEKDSCQEDVVASLNNKLVSAYVVSKVLKNLAENLNSIQVLVNLIHHDHGVTFLTIVAKVDFVTIVEKGIYLVHPTVMDNQWVQWVVFSTVEINSSPDLINSLMNVKDCKDLISPFQSLAFGSVSDGNIRKITLGEEFMPSHGRNERSGIMVTTDIFSAVIQSFLHFCKQNVDNWPQQMIFVDWALLDIQGDFAEFIQWEVICPRQKVFVDELKEESSDRINAWNNWSRSICSNLKNRCNGGIKNSLQKEQVTRMEAMGSKLADEEQDQSEASWIEEEGRRIKNVSSKKKRPSTRSQFNF